MKRLRNLLLAGVTALGLMLPAPADVRANHPPTVPHGHPRTYTVYYRVSLTAPWHRYGRFHHVSQAERAVAYLRSAGYQSYYR